MMIFGGGSLDVFYIDKIEQSIKKEVTDKERKKDLLNDLKEYNKTVKGFKKEMKSQLKELKKKNLEITTTETWYREFYDSRMKARIELQKTFIEQRLILQNKIAQDEWDAIMNRAKDATAKLAEKERKDEMKKKYNNAFKDQENAIINSVGDQNRRKALLDALFVFKQLYIQIDEAYDSINVNESEFLTDKNATEEEMIKLASLLNEQRVKLFAGNTLFLKTMHSYTSEEEWKPIMKAYNKLLD